MKFFNKHAKNILRFQCNLPCCTPGKLLHLHGADRCLLWMKIRCPLAWNGLLLTTTQLLCYFGHSVGLEALQHGQQFSPSCISCSSPYSVWVCDRGRRKYCSPRKRSDPLNLSCRMNLDIQNTVPLLVCHNHHRSARDRSTCLGVHCLVWGILNDSTLSSLLCHTWSAPHHLHRWSIRLHELERCRIKWMIKMRKLKSWFSQDVLQLGCERRWKVCKIFVLQCKIFFMQEMPVGICINLSPYAESNKIKEISWRTSIFRIVFPQIKTKGNWMTEEETNKLQLLQQKGKTRGIQNSSFKTEPNNKQNWLQFFILV